MKGLVSIIVPIYNVENYIEECIISILGQNYSNLEILLIDDQSSDRSFRICEDYAAKDHRVRLFQKEHEGVSKARNVGLEEAKGEFICFVDSDDKINDCYIETLVSMMEGDMDIAICMTAYGKEKYSCEPDKTKRIVWNEKEALIQYIFYNRYSVGTNGKLFRKDCLKGLRFDEKIRIAEDKLFFFQAVKGSEKIVYKNCCLYFYRIRQGSAMNSKFDERFLDNKKVTDYLYVDWCLRFPELKRFFYKEKLISYARMVQRSVLDSSIEATEVRGVFLKELRESHFIKILLICHIKEIVLLFLAKYWLWGLKMYESKIK